MTHFYIVSITVIYGHMAMACYPHNNIHLIIFNCWVLSGLTLGESRVPPGTQTITHTITI